MRICSIILYLAILERETHTLTGSSTLYAELIGQFVILQVQWVKTDPDVCPCNALRREPGKEI